MARIRSIKPEFPQSESIGRLSRDARLLFIQIWTLVDDEGRTRAASRMLASLLYPYDDDARDLIGDWLNELEAEKCLVRYEADGTQYLEICNWLKHQKIDHPSPSRLPSPSEGSRIIREDSRALAPDLGPRTKDLGSRIKSSLRSDSAREAFQEFKSAYPKRTGSQPWMPAEKKFLEHVKRGVDPAEIITGARAYAGSPAASDPQFVAQAVTWLNQARWKDEYHPADSSTGPPSKSKQDLRLAGEAW